MKKKLLVLTLVLITMFLAAFSIRGQSGDPIAFQKDYTVSIGSPFESSGSASRFALTEAIVKNHTFFLTGQLKDMAFPDIVAFNGNYFSIFTPGISFLGIPFYILGSLVNLPQLVTYLPITLISIINIFLIAKLSRKLGAGEFSSYLAGLIFYFATNALSYGATFTQHQVTVFVILISLINALKERTALNNLLFGLIFGFGALVDIPVIFLLLPIAIYVFFKNFSLKSLKSQVDISVKLPIVILLLSFIPFLGLFAFYNYETTGSFTKIGQSIGRVPNEEDLALAKITQKSSAITLVNTPFETRNELNSLYILLISNERSWLFYSPVILIGILGLFISYKKKTYQDLTILIISVLLVNIAIYSMFGDPWGGWSFGPRYLLPGASMLAIGLGVAIQNFKRDYIFLAIFFPTLLYSILVSTAGTITTNQIPPKIETENLQSPIPYTYQYNLDQINQGKISSLIYNLKLKSALSARDFWLFYTFMIFVFLTLVFSKSWKESKND